MDWFELIFRLYWPEILAFTLVVIVLIVFFYFFAHFSKKGFYKIYSEGDSYFWTFKSGNIVLQSRESFPSPDSAKWDLFQKLKKRGVLID